MQPTITIALRAARVISESMTFLQRELQADKDNPSAMQQRVTRSIDDCLDRASQILSKAYPDQQIITDDLDCPAEQENFWQIGGFSGLNDFLRGGHQLSFTIAQYQKGRLEHCLISFPNLEQYFSASRSRGAQMNDGRLRCRFTEKLSELRLAISSSELADWLASQPELNYSSYDNPILMHCQVAAGIFDASLSQAISILNQDSINLLLQESGAITGQANGHPLTQKGKQSILSAHPKTFKQLVILQQQG